MIQKVVLIGCGIHYREKYHDILQKRNVEIVLLIDLKQNEGVIRSFFQIQPKHFLFLDECHRNSPSIEHIEALIMGIDLSGVAAALICTEPKVRKIYAIWAARHGWDLFMDKPIVAFKGLENIDSLQNDVDEIITAVNTYKVRAVVSCERRAHLGYEWLQERIKERPPLTSIDIHFAGGVWKTPFEYASDENHPFRYGYGILLHSGYHYIDLLARWLESPDKMSIQVMASSPFEGYGEADFLMIGDAFSEGIGKTHFAMKLFGTSLSNRCSEETTSKLEGRIRQEKITLHFGHLSSVHIQSIAYKKFLPHEYPVEEFSVTIMNSPLLKGAQPLIRLHREDFSALFPELPLTASMNTFSRRWQLKEFLEGRDGNSPLISHRDTMKLLHNIYTLLRTRQEV